MGKKGKTMSKKVTAMVLTVLLVLTMLPATSFGQPAVQFSDMPQD